MVEPATVVEEKEVSRGRLETAETFQRESLGGNSVKLPLPAAAQMAAADTPQNGSREETVVAAVDGGAQQAGKAGATA